MKTDEFIKEQEYLIDKWCTRKELNPLRHILNGISSLNGLTDGLEEMLGELQTIRSQYAQEIAEDEMEAVVKLIHATEAALKR